MNRAVSLALLAGGILLIIFGIMASTSFTSDISRFFTGSPTDKAIWMLVGGVVASVVIAREVSEEVALAIGVRQVSEGRAPVDSVPVG